jgi:hypothetical protein
MIKCGKKQFKTKEDATKYLHRVIESNPVMRQYYWSTKWKSNNK